METILSGTVFSRVAGIVLVTVLGMLTLMGCGADERDDQLTMLRSENEALKERTEFLENSVENLSQQTSLLGTAVNVMALLANRDFVSLSTYVHPSQGVRFSPYGYVDVKNHLRFEAKDIADLPLNTTVYTWGGYDGSAHPIELNFADYYTRFVYDQDFVNPHIVGINHIIGLGSSLVNISDVHPNGSFLEFHFTGFDPQKYEGADWCSLFLVFEQLDGNWVLVGIVHNEWTI